MKTQHDYNWLHLITKNAIRLLMITNEYRWLQLITTYFTPPKGTMIGASSWLHRSGCGRSVMTATPGDHGPVVLCYFSRRAWGNAVWVGTIQLLCWSVVGLCMGKWWCLLVNSCVICSTWNHNSWLENQLLDWTCHEWNSPSGATHERANWPIDQSKISIYSDIGSYKSLIHRVKMTHRA